MKTETGIDERILDALSDDARASAAAIARRIGVAPSTVRRRIDALYENGTITKFTIVRRAEARLEQVQAVIEIFCRGNVSPAELAAMVRSLPFVTFAVTVAGAADALVVVSAESATSVAETVEQLRASGKVDRTRTSVVFHNLLAHPAPADHPTLTRKTHETRASASASATP